MKRRDHKKKNKTMLIVSLFLCLGVLSPYLVFSQDNSLMSTQVGRGGSLWQSSRKIAESLGMQARDFWKGWKKSIVMVDDAEVHISKIDRVYPETKVSWDDVQGRFRVEGKGITSKPHAPVTPAPVKKVQAVKVEVVKAKVVEAATPEVKREYREIQKNNVWSTTNYLAKSVGLKGKAFGNAWRKSYANIRGEKVHFSQVSLVHPETKIFWNPARGAFEIEGQGIGSPQDLRVSIEGKNSLKIKRASKRDVSKPVNKKKLHDPLYDPNVEIGGLLLDQTQTRLAQSFYRHFASHWQGGQNDSFTITVIEKSSPRAGVRVFVKVNDSIVHQSFLRARGQNVDEIAKKGVTETRKYIDERRMGI